MRPLYYDRVGRPITDVLEWAKLFEDPDYRRVAETTLPNGKWVSTVWLGIDHNFGSGAPLLFETMVFPSKNEMGELDCDRYSTEGEALVGHASMIAKWSKPTVH